MNKASVDKLLLGGRFAPITFQIGFLELEPVAAVHAFTEWHAGVVARMGNKVSVREVKGDLAAVLTALLPITTGVRRRYLFAPTASGWTAYLDNGYLGSEVFSHVGYLSNKVGCRGLRVVASPSIPFKQVGGKWRGTYGSIMLEVYGPLGPPPLRVQRAIAAANDGGHWVFVQSGTPFEFEHTERYTERRIRDRFTLKMLDEYLRHFGIRAFDEDFYLPEGRATLVEDHGPVPPRTRTYTLAERQAELW